MQTDHSHWHIEFELHLVLEKGSSMYYYYSIHKYTNAMANGYSAGQLRWAHRCNHQVFKYFNVDGKRAGAFPTDEQMKGATTIQDATSKLKDGYVLIISWIIQYYNVISTW